MQLGRYAMVAVIAAFSSVAAAAPSPSTSVKPAPSAAPKPPSSASAPKPPPLPAPKATPKAKPDAKADAKDPKKGKEKETEPEKADKEPKPPNKALTSPNTAMQKAIAGGSASTESSGAESTELKALREAELDLFVGAAPPLGQPWPSELPTPPKGPFAMAGGLPPSEAPSPPLAASVGGGSLAWLSTLKMPDLPVRWDTRVVRYLEFFKDDPRGRRIMNIWYKRSGRYRELIQPMLRAKSLPEDLAWVAMAESGFDPAIKSPAGALGLWQFMPESAKIYGLSTDRWADARISPVRATEAAINFLSDLKKRFGTWELALAAYNMGYGGALAAVKKFNSNDYWELSRFENGLPWETTLYVPKIIALAVVMRNPDVFGYDNVQKDASLDGDLVDVPAGAELKSIALAAGCPLADLQSRNPELRAGRTPPTSTAKGSIDDGTYAVLVPKGKGAAVKDASGKLAPKGSTLERYVVRFGETLDMIATARKTTKQKLVELNGIGKGEVVRGGTVLLVPPLPAGSATTGTAIAAEGAPLPVALVPGTTFAYPDRQRLFYRVIVGDTPRDIAEAFGVSVDELRTWNAIEPTARLQEGMTLQVFAPKSVDLGKVMAMKSGDVKIVAIGSDDFYAIEEAAQGRKRLTVYAKGGETLEVLGKKHGITPAKMEKINRRPRTDVLAKGEALIVYVKSDGAAAETKTATKDPKPTATTTNTDDVPAQPQAQGEADATDGDGKAE